MILTSAAKGAPLTPTEADANLTELDARTAAAWQNLTMPLQTAGLATPPTFDLYHGCAVHSFEPLNNQSGSTYFHIPHDYVPGSDIYPHLHFTISQPGSGVVRWGFTYTFAKEYVHGGDNTYAQFPSPTTQYVEYALDAGDVDMAMLAETAVAISSPAIEKDTIILMSIFRDASHVNDTFPYPCLLLATDIYYRSQNFGTSAR